MVTRNRPITDPGPVLVSCPDVVPALLTADPAEDEVADVDELVGGLEVWLVEPLVGLLAELGELVVAEPLLLAGALALD